MAPAWTTATGLLAGAAVDLVVADPHRAHPVAAYGRAAGHLERVLYADSRVRGAAFAVAAVVPPVLAARALERALPLPLRAGVTAAATWVVVGGTSLRRVAGRLAAALERGDLPAARAVLPSLCGRDPAGLDAGELSRAGVESVAENTSDAQVGALLWGALAGVPGLVAYRSVNTLDATVGHRSARYARFGWACARLDDLANLAPARVTGLLACALAPVVGGRPSAALRTMLRDGSHHPSPNAGWCEAAFAGALGLRLGGVNRYGDRTEVRPALGGGAAPTPRDLRRAVRLSGAVSAASVLLAVLLSTLLSTLLPGRDR